MKQLITNQRVLGAGALMCGVLGVALPTQAMTLEFFQGFEGAAGDTFTFSNSGGSVSSSSGSGDTPSNSRIFAGSNSFQVNNTTGTLTFDQIDISSLSGVMIEFKLSSTSGTSGNGADTSDTVQAFAALDGAAFGSADITLNGNNNARFDYTGATESTVAGTPLSVQATSGDPISTLQLLIPNGTNTVDFRIAANNNSSNEYWNIDNVSVFSGLTVPEPPPTPMIGDTLIHQESFESAPSPTTYSLTNENGASNTSDYFGRRGTGTAPGNNFSGADGDWLVAGEDIENSSTTSPEGVIEIEDIDIEGLTDLGLRGLFASNSTSAFDDPDGIRIEARIDDGSFVLIGAFEANGDESNEALALDTNLDGFGDGDTELSSTFAEYDFLIDGTGSLLDIRITLDFNSGNEEAAVDNIRIYGTIPEPSSLALLGLGGLLIARRRRNG